MVIQAQQEHEILIFLAINYCIQLSLTEISLIYLKSYLLKKWL
jgi:hypothetical protein